MACFERTWHRELATSSYQHWRLSAAPTRALRRGRDLRRTVAAPQTIWSDWNSRTRVRGTRRACGMMALRHVTAGGQGGPRTQLEVSPIGKTFGFLPMLEYLSLSAARKRATKDRGMARRECTAKVHLVPDVGADATNTSSADAAWDARGIRAS
ncbi:uncharacterized protein LAJ45_06180 [Morchella importuna]|uniref:uncharacterized protein n=1 Tax=Morchella importuna TaxID=1174673 RepID=UPI001E8D2B36|nr:uncharacterized protein LAJ45_06180 [Morchella importuna]KAH8149551.1 hypothetical protein LAJ45_06180 [Morchella importuna]